VCRRNLTSRKKENRQTNFLRCGHRGARGTSASRGCMEGSCLGKILILGCSTVSRKLTAGEGIQAMYIKRREGEGEIIGGGEGKGEVVLSELGGSYFLSHKRFGKQNDER